MNILRTISLICGIAITTTSTLYVCEQFWEELADAREIRRIVGLENPQPGTPAGEQYARATAHVAELEKQIEKQETRQHQKSLLDAALQKSKTQQAAAVKQAPVVKDDELAKAIALSLQEQELKRAQDKRDARLQQTFGAVGDEHEFVPVEEDGQPGLITI